jgi:hypothetical protein
LKKGYNILLFKGYYAYYGTWSSIQYHQPEECELGKVCLCLYKDTPKLGIVGTDDGQKTSSEDLVKCRVLDKVINFDLDYQPVYQNIGGVVRIGTDNPYKSYIIAKRVIYPEKKEYIYVLENNETNKALNKEWSIPVCKTTDENDLCYGKKSGDVVEAVDESSRSKIYNYCTRKEDPKYKSLAVLCEYPPVGNDCIPDCSYLDSTELCKYNSCGEYNKLTRNINNNVRVKYISADDDYIQYSLCEIDNAFCDVSKYGVGCDIQTWEVYACNDDDADEGFADTPGLNDETDKINENCLPPLKEIVDEENKNIDCKVTYLEYNTNKIQFYTNNVQKSLIISYDETNQVCKDYMTEHFYDKSTVLTCKKGKDVECKTFISDSERWIKAGRDDYACELKIITAIDSSGAEVYWLTHYSKTDKDCEKNINELFTTVSLCKSVD